MNKKLFLGMFAAAGMLFATSCSQEALEPAVDGGSESATVSFVVNTEDALATRAIGDGTKVDKLYYAVYNETVGSWVAHDGIEYNGSTTLKLALAKGQTYKLGFWACNSTTGAIPTWEYYGYVLHGPRASVNDDAFDAFTGNLTYTVSGSDLQSVTLKRPYAQINVGVKQADYDAAVAAGITIARAKVELQGTFGYDFRILDGTVTVTEDNFSSNWLQIPANSEVLTVNGENYKYLVSMYVMPAEVGVSQTVDAKFTFNDMNGHEIVLEDGVSNLPIKSNYRTNIIGNVLTSNVDFEVVVDEDFDGENNTALWDGSSVSAPSQDAAGVYHINTAEDFAWIMNQRGVNSLLLGKTVVLDTDIDFAGQTISGVGDGNCNFAGTFDGNGHTISNFVIDHSSEPHYAGLFCQVSSGAVIKNLTVKGATVIGNKQVGVIASSLDAASIEKCHVENCVVVAKVKKAGAITGYTSNSTVKDCTAKNVEVYCADPAEAESGEIIGYENNGTTESGNSFTNVTVVRGTDLVISTAAELVAFANDVNNNDNTYIDKTVILAKDIDLAGIDWTPIGGPGAELADPFYGTFDGRGHTIKNLHVVEKPGVDVYDAIGFFGWLDGFVKNLNFEDAYVEGHHDVAVVAGYLVGSVNGQIKDVTVNRATVKATYLNSDRDGDKAGAIVGFHNGGYVKATVTNSTVEAVRDAGTGVGCTADYSKVNVSADLSSAVVNGVRTDVIVGRTL